MNVNGYVIKPYADLAGANLAYTNLRGADLRGATLIGADLTNANLSGADLRDANLRFADLYGANLTNANLRFADLYGANLTNANLADAIGYNQRENIMNNTPHTKMFDIVDNLANSTLEKRKVETHHPQQHNTWHPVTIPTRAVFKNVRLDDTILFTRYSLIAYKIGDNSITYKDINGFNYSTDRRDFAFVEQLHDGAWSL